MKEKSTDKGEPFYPIPRTENQILYEKYKKLADSQKGVSFVGRLAQYRYFNIDQVVEKSLEMACTLLE